MLPKGLKFSSGSHNGNVWLSTEYEWYIWVEDPTQEINKKSKWFKDEYTFRYGDIVIAKRKGEKEIVYYDEFDNIVEENREWLENLNIREEKLKRII